MPGEAEAFAFVEKLNDIILFPLIALLTGVAMLYFLWGAFQYIANADNDQARSTGRQHMLWGVIGLLIMLSAYTILLIAAGTIGLDDELDCIRDAAGGCVEPTDARINTPGPS